MAGVRTEPDRIPSEIRACGRKDGPWTSESAFLALRRAGYRDDAEHRRVRLKRSSPLARFQGFSYDVLIDRPSFAGEVALEVIAGRRALADLTTTTREGR